MITITRRHHFSKDHQWLPVVIAAFMGLLLFFIFLGFWQITFVDALSNMLQVFLDKESFLFFLTTATPFIFCGLASAIAFRAGIHNFAAEAQFVAGFATAVIIIKQNIDNAGLLLLPLIIIAAAISGIGVALMVGLLRRQTGLHEILSSALMVIATRWLLSPLIENIDPGASLAGVLSAINLLPNMLFGITHHGFFYAMVVALVMALLHRYHIIFFQIKLMGYGRHAMVETGQKERNIYWFIILLGGLLVGTAGGIALLDNIDKLQTDGTALLPPLWLLTMAMVVAVYMGRMTPIGVVAVSLFLGLVAAMIKNIDPSIGDNGFFEIFCALNLLLLLLIDFFYRYKINMSDLFYNLHQGSKKQSPQQDKMTKKQKDKKQNDK